MEQDEKITDLADAPVRDALASARARARGLASLRMWAIVQDEKITDLTEAHVRDVLASATELSRALDALCRWARMDEQKRALIGEAFCHVRGAAAALAKVLGSDAKD